MPPTSVGIAIAVHSPREVTLKRRLAVLPALALMGVGLVGCMSTEESLESTIRRYFEEDPVAGKMLCGYAVRSLRNVTVSSVERTGSDAKGTGTLNVTATPRVIQGSGASGAPCSATVTYAYETIKDRSYITRKSLVRTKSDKLHIYDITVTRRDGDE